MLKKNQNKTAFIWGFYVRRVHFKLCLSHKFSQHNGRICSVSVVRKTESVSACFMASRRFYGCWGLAVELERGQKGEINSNHNDVVWREEGRGGERFICSRAWLELITQVSEQPGWLCHNSKYNQSCFFSVQLKSYLTMWIHTVLGWCAPVVCVRQNIVNAGFRGGQGLRFTACYSW